MHRDGADTQRKSKGWEWERQRSDAVVGCNTCWIECTGTNMLGPMAGLRSFTHLLFSPTKRNRESEVEHPIAALNGWLFLRFPVEEGSPRTVSLAVQ